MTNNDVIDELGLVLAALGADDLDAAEQLEQDSYPADEAASRERIAFRIANAGEHFRGLWTASRDQLVGFVNGTRSEHARLTHDAMAGHAPAGTNLCIHSVVVAPHWRRKGVGQAMLRRYIAAERARADATGVKQLTLLCKEALQGFYQDAGFTLVGPSDVNHGAEQWFEYILHFN